MKNLETLLKVSRNYHLEKISDIALDIKNKSNEIDNRIWQTQDEVLQKLIQEYTEYRKKIPKGVTLDNRKGLNSVIDEIDRKIRGWTKQLEKQKENKKAVNAVSMWNNKIRLQSSLNKYQIGLDFIDRKLDKIQQQRREHTIKNLNKE